MARKIVRLHPRDVGLAFLTLLGAAQVEPNKTKRRVAFNRLLRTLQSLRLLDGAIVWEYITLGVDRNGDGIIIAEGSYKNQRPTAKKVGKA